MKNQFNTNTQPKKSSKLRKYSKKTRNVIVICVGIFLTLIISTIIFSVMLSPFQSKKNDEVVSTILPISDVNQGQTTNYFKSDFDFGNFKVKSNLPNGWKGTYEKNVDTKVINVKLFNNIGDIIDMEFIPKSTNNNNETINTGGDGSDLRSKNLYQIGNILGIDMYRETDVEDIANRQVGSREYLFMIFHKTSDSKYSTTLPIKNMNVRVLYKTPSNEFTSYRAVEIINSIDAVLKTLSFS